jgi:hypothetical protein
MIDANQRKKNLINGVCSIRKSLKFASPCIIMQFKYVKQLEATISQISFLTFITAQHVSGVLTPSIRRSTTAVADSGFTVGS